MRALAILWLVLAGCPEPGEPDPMDPVPDIFDGEGTAWAWGTPACAVTRSSPDAPGATIRWRDAFGRVVRGELRTAPGDPAATTLQFRVGFDRDGRRAIADGPSGTRRWIYDDRGRVETEWLRDRGRDAFTDHVRDGAGRLIERATTASGGWWFVQRWTRDEAGRIVGYDAENTGGAISRATWVRDREGHPIASRSLGMRGDDPVWIDITFAWRGDSLVGERTVIEPDFDSTIDYVRDEAGELIEVTTTAATLDVVSRLALERSPLGITRMREADAAGATRWTVALDRTPGRVVRTEEIAGDPGHHAVERLDDACAPGGEPIADFDIAFAPAWPVPFLPEEPE